MLVRLGRSWSELESRRFRTIKPTSHASARLRGLAKAALGASMDSMRSIHFNLLFGLFRPCSSTTGKKHKVASIGRNRETTWDSSKLILALLPASKYQRRGEVQNHAPHAYVAEESAQETRFVKSTEAE